MVHFRDVVQSLKSIAFLDGNIRSDWTWRVHDYGCIPVHYEASHFGWSDGSLLFGVQSSQDS